MFLTNITLFGCMICILCNSSSFINVASASSIRYADICPVVKVILSDYNDIVFYLLLISIFCTAEMSTRIVEVVRWVTGYDPRAR